MTGGVDDGSDHIAPLVWESFYWGFLSAVSLNIGSAIGVTCLPGKKARAMLMAFGGGALLFALSIELFGRVLYDSEGSDSRAPLLIMEASAVLGGLFFAALNYALNVLGASIRKESTTKSRFARLRRLLMQRLAARLNKIPFFSALDSEELKDLIQSAMYKQRFSAGDVILSGDNTEKGIYFILSGEVHLRVYQNEDATSEPLSPGPPKKQRSGGAAAMLHLSETVGLNSGLEKLSELTGIRKSGAWTGEGSGSIVGRMGRRRSHSDIEQQLATLASQAYDDDLLHEWTLGHNQIFGDMTVLTGSHHRAVATALSNVKVLVLPQMEVARLAETKPAVCEQLARRSLRAVPEFKQLSDAALERLAKGVSVFRHQKGDLVYRGVVQESTDILCLVLGSIDVKSKLGKHSLQASSLLCTEHFLSGSTSPPIIAKATQPTLVLHIPRADVDDAFSQNKAEAFVVQDVDTEGASAAESTVALPGQVLDSRCDPVDSSTPTQEPRSPAPQQTPSPLTTPKDASKGPSKLVEFARQMSGELARQVSGELKRQTSGSMDGKKSIGSQDPEDAWAHLGWDGDDAAENSMDNDAAWKTLRIDACPLGQISDVDLADLPCVQQRRSSSKRSSFSSDEMNSDGSVNRSHMPPAIPTMQRSPTIGGAIGAINSVYSGPIGPGAAAPAAGGHDAGHHRAIMVWLGILIDAIPESLVIGIIINRSFVEGEDINRNAAAAVLPFVIGVFISNLPESMSSSGSMKAHGMSVRTILLMWLTTTVLTAAGSAIGAVLFPPGSSSGHGDDPASLAIVAVEGLAAGAMLTMIAQTMMPEAFEQGGDIVGLSCLAGFLAALSVKLIPIAH